MAKTDAALMEEFLASQATRTTGATTKAPTKAPLGSLLKNAGRDAHAILSAQNVGESRTVPQTTADMRDLILSDARERLLSLAAAITHQAQNLSADDVNVSARVGRDGGRTGTAKFSVNVRDDSQAQDGSASGWVSVTLGTAYGFALSRYAPTEK